MSSVVDKPSERYSEPASRVRYLPYPTGVFTLFCFDLLAVALIYGVMLGALSYLQTSVTIDSVTMAPWQLLTGNAILLVIASAVLVNMVTMAFSHVRYLVYNEGDFRFHGFIGLLLVMGILAATGFTLFQFYTAPGDFVARVFGHFGVQSILVVVTLYYAAMLKHELIGSLYDNTIDSGIARLNELQLHGDMSSRVERDALRTIRQDRTAKLDEFNRQLDAHMHRLHDSQQ